jgi:pyruvate formate lyase activating enzyme
MTELAERPATENPAPGPVREAYLAGTAPFSALDGPGNRYVLFLQGCGWDCLSCHNSCSIPIRPPLMKLTSIEEVLAGIRDVVPFLTGVTVTGGEATLQDGFVRELFTELAADPATARLSRFVDSNGDADLRVWQALAPVTDGVMLDLKALDDEMHVILTGHSNRRVLASIVDLARRRLLHEVRLLFVPGLNDSPDTIEQTARWLLAIDPDVRVRVIGFRREGTRPCARDLLEPTEDDVAGYRSQLVEAGVRHLV